MTYNASSIKVLSGAEAIAAFPFALVDHLAEKYSRPYDWVRRGVETCYMLGVDQNYFEEYYLKKSDVFEHNPEFESHFSALAAVEYRKRSGMG